MRIDSNGILMPENALITVGTNQIPLQKLISTVQFVDNLKSLCGEQFERCLELLIK